LSKGGGGDVLKKYYLISHIYFLSLSSPSAVKSPMDFS
jgi:hypothetical protein